MIHRPISLLALLAASAMLAACQTTDSAPQETITWDKPASTVPATPQPPVARGQGEPQCREYQTTITIGGVPQKAYGRACRQPDGTWKDENVLRDQPYSETPPARVENIHPYGWRGYHYPEHPYYGHGGLSIGVGAGTRGGYMGYGVGF
jgi:hypothetical protein